MKIALKRVQFEVGDRFFRLVGERADVNVFCEPVAFEQVYSDVAQVVDGVGQFHAEDAATSDQALVVLTESEDVDLSVLLVPVASDALESRRAVVESVRVDTYIGFFQRDLLSF